MRLTIFIAIAFWGFCVEAMKIQTDLKKLKNRQKAINPNQRGFEGFPGWPGMPTKPGPECVVICQNGGACYDGIFSAECQCPPGFKGRLCQCEEGSNCDDEGEEVPHWYCGCHEYLDLKESIRANDDAEAIKDDDDEGSMGSLIQEEESIRADDYGSDDYGSEDSDSEPEDSDSGDSDRDNQA